ncbi:YfiR family protein [Fulvivirga ligni]|uniref:YfiR family protein n=1 Tax=Fulvivirga ligni TaxID=2904246 RepID=UPI001F435DF2|nr:YfiR family protein [Fulvivirga ligni]UII19511.1 YfiR family protein [Fulvivirga ligni]
MKKHFLIGLFLLLSVVSFAQNYQAHAVYIYSFIRYVQWPSSSADGDFTIGVVGDSPITEYLQKMADVKKVGSRDIVIKNFTNINGLENCDLVFVSKEYTENFSVILGKLGRAHTLVITEKEGMGVAGSNINFVQKNGKLAFEINKSAMQRADLKVSSELTRLAILI